MEFSLRVYDSIDDEPHELASNHCKILLLDRFLIHGAQKLHKGSKLVRLDHYVGILLETKIAMKFGDDAVIY